LGHEALAIAVERTITQGRGCVNMTAINGTNSAFEVGPEFWAIANLVGDDAAVRKAYMRGVEWGGGKNEQYLAKIPDTNRLG